jgi:amylosucrase
MADLQALAADLHERGIALCIDLVLNHTAREHEWARKALAGETRPTVTCTCLP